MSIKAYHFWSPTCGPCKHIEPAIRQLKQDFGEVNWVSVNTHDDKDNLALVHNVRVVPTIVVQVKDYDGNSLGFQRASGVDMMQYHRMIRQAIRVVSQLNTKKM